MDCTCSALRMAARRLTQAYDAALAPHGISTAQFALLGALGRWQEADPPTVNQLAHTLAMDRTTLAHNLRPLDRDGLVAVVADNRDRRIHRVLLTEAGHDKREKAWPSWRAAQDRFDASFGEQRSRELRMTLQDVARLPEGPAPAEKDHHHAV